MIVKIKKIKHYAGPIYQATQELRDITRQLDRLDFAEYMKIFNVKFYTYYSGGGRDNDLEIVDSLCAQKTSGVKKYSHVCLMPGKGCQHVVEATSEEILSLFSRVDQLKAFL